MKTTNKTMCVAAAVVGMCGFSQGALTDGMEAGDVGLKSAGSLAFGPEGILFIADAKAASVVAVATGDTKAAGDGALSVEGIGKKVAALLGTKEDDILINDLAVNPASGAAFLSVSRGRGPEGVPVLVRVAPGGELAAVSLDGVKHSKVALSDAPADEVTGEGRRRRNKIR